MIFLGLLFLPTFAAKSSDVGVTINAADTVGIGVGVEVAVAVGVTVAVLVAVTVAVAVGVAVGVAVAVAVGVRVLVADVVAVAVDVAVAVPVGVAVAVAVAVCVAVVVAVAVGEGVPVAVDGVPVRLGVAVIDGVGVPVLDAVGVGVGVGGPVEVAVGVGVEPGDPSPRSSNIPRPCVAANTTPLRFCSISKIATAGIAPRLKGAQSAPPSVVLKMPMSVAASTVFPVGSLRSTSSRSTGTSGIAFGGLCRFGLPSASVHVPPKSVVTKT